MFPVELAARLKVSIPRPTNERERYRTTVRTAEMDAIKFVIGLISILMFLMTVKGNVDEALVVMKRQNS